MQTTFGYDSSRDDAENTPSWPMPQRIEKERLEIKSRQYVLEKASETLVTPSESAIAPTERDVESTLLEWDITGARVRAIGQATGGYLREVIENEAAFSNSIQDDVSLYLLMKISEAPEPVDIRDLEDIVKNSRGWERVILLVRGGLLDLVGSEVRATERGIRELHNIKNYCTLKNE